MLRSNAQINWSNQNAIALIGIAFQTGCHDNLLRLSAFCFNRPNATRLLEAKSLCSFCHDGSLFTLFLVFGGLRGKPFDRCRVVFKTGIPASRGNFRNQGWCGIGFFALRWLRQGRAGAADAARPAVCQAAGGAQVASPQSTILHRSEVIRCATSKGTAQLPVGRCHYSGLAAPRQLCLADGDEDNSQRRIPISARSDLSRPAPPGKSLDTRFSFPSFSG